MASSEPCIEHKDKYSWDHVNPHSRKREDEKKKGTRIIKVGILSFLENFVFLVVRTWQFTCYFDVRSFRNVAKCSQFSYNSDPFNKLYLVLSPRKSRTHQKLHDPPHTLGC